MYNRYIPQPDGSFRRNRMPEPPREAPRAQPSREERRTEAPREAPCPPAQNPPNNGGQPCSSSKPPRRPSPPPKQPPNRSQPKDSGIGGFFRQLLPRDFDTEDLLIVLLLLLMSGDCQEDQNTALLTLALYLFL